MFFFTGSTDFDRFHESIYKAVKLLITGTLFYSTVYKD